MRSRPTFASSPTASSPPESRSAASPDVHSIPPTKICAKRHAGHTPVLVAKLTLSGSTQDRRGTHPDRRDRLHPMEAAPLDHRGSRCHGRSRRLRRHHRQSAVPWRAKADRCDGNQRPRLVCKRHCGRSPRKCRPGRLLLLRATSLLQAKGTLGLIATNTVAQGDCEVGLDTMVAAGFTITRAIQSRPWPAASANLEYAAVWGTLAVVGPDVPSSGR